MKYQPKIEKEYMTPVEDALRIFGGKWKVRIIGVLSVSESTRYKDIKENLKGITDTVLAAMLKEMAEDGLVERKQFDEIPLRVEYALSPRGKSLHAILQDVCRWARDNLELQSNYSLLPCQNCPFLSENQKCTSI